MMLAVINLYHTRHSPLAYQNFKSHYLHEILNYFYFPQLMRRESPTLPPIWAIILIRLAEDPLAVEDPLVVEEGRYSPGEVRGPSP